MREDVQGAVDPDACPGQGKCHGCMQWCNDCGDVKYTCDFRPMCDAHPHADELSEALAEQEEADREVTYRAGLLHAATEIQVAATRRVLRLRGRIT